MKKSIKAYEDACKKVRREFEKKYFPPEPDSWWVADEIGDVLYINDYYLSMQDMIVALKFDATFEQIDAWYAYIIDNKDKDKSLYSFLKWNS